MAPAVAGQVLATVLLEVFSSTITVVVEIVVVVVEDMMLSPSTSPELSSASSALAVGKSSSIIDSTSRGMNFCLEVRS